MASYKQYAEYKDSGVEWLGEVPNQWISTQVKYGYTVVLGKMLQTTPKSNSDLLKPYLKAQNVQPSGIDLTNVGSMWFSVDERKRLLLKRKDVLVSEGGDVGRAAIWDNEIDECYIQNAINRVRPRHSNDSRFFYYWINYLKSTDFINIICNKATIAHYTADKLQGSPLILPSALEQTQIGNFLDHETAQIDTLIKKQQTLIKLLKEKRQAVISHAVTKGLNPDAPMKDSGVEWLGKVPEHWTVSPLKLYIDTRKGVAFKASDFTDKGIRVVKASDIKDKTIRQSDIFLPVSFSDVYPKAILKEGDIIVSTVGSTPDVKNSAVGQIGMLPVELKESLLNQNTVVFSPRNKILEKLFLFYLIQTDVYRDHLDLNAHGTANQASLNVSDMLNFTFARPSREEQLEISEHIVEFNSSFDALEKNCVTAIELMQERRTALISAAVTGKIDVRGWEKT